ncbi:MAG: glycosyltransferase family 4 protein [Kiritimatiellae bacterium]|nr:glycosyltransferase family 4 protein [Kiritimatiellia bacterium]MDW8459020.1 glycosyltransferase family 4 protein [Verrucomicrobiota bacterium]
MKRVLSDQIVVDVTPPELVFRLPNRLHTAVYWRWLYYCEYAIRRFYWRSERTLVHHFHSENTMLRDDRWKRHHLLVATVHQPFEELLRPVPGHPSRPKFLNALRACDAVIALSECERPVIDQFLGDRRTVAIPQGVDCAFFRPPTFPRAHVEPPRVLTVGNWLRDYDTWCETAKIVLDRHPTVRFAVVANAENHRLIRTRLAERLSRIELHHGISDDELVNLYWNSRMVFLPLRHAVMNNAVLESLATGTPLVATDIPSVREYAGPAGIYVPRNDAESAAESILALLGETEELETRSAQARERAVSRYDWPIIADLHRQLYRRLYGESSDSLSQRGAAIGA